MLPMDAPRSFTESPIDNGSQPILRLIPAPPQERPTALGRTLIDTCLASLGNGYTAKRPTACATQVRPKEVLLPYKSLADGRTFVRAPRLRRGIARKEEAAMNKDQVAGKAKEVTGKVQQAVGEATGSASQQIKGGAKQVEGKVQQGVGDVKDTLKDADRKTR